MAKKPERIRTEKVQPAQAAKYNAIREQVQREFPPVDYSAVAAALDVYDREYAREPRTDAEWDAHLAAITTAAQKVGEAFADATADRNQRSDAVRLGVSPPKPAGQEVDDCWIRKQVRQWKARSQ